MIDGWRHWYRCWCGWFPVQFCMVCGKPYWGGFPRIGRWYGKGRIRFTWLAWWKDYCSRACADEDLELSEQSLGPWF